MKIRNFNVLFLIGYISYCLVYISRLNLSIAYTELTNISSEQYGYICSAFLIAFSCGRLINGIIGDNIHPRYMLYIGLTLAGAANIGLSFIPPFAVFIVLWSVNGYAQSMLWGSLLSYISYIAPVKKRVKVVSFLVSSVAVGSVAGLLIATFSTTLFGVRAAFLVPGILSVTLAFLPLIAFNEKIVRPEAAGRKHISMLQLLKYPCVYAMLAPAILHGVIKDNISSWAPKYFQVSYGLGLSAMQLFVYIIPVIGMIGRLLYPSIYQLFRHKENLVSIFAAGLCVVSMLPLILGVDNIIVAAVSLSLTNAAINIINTSMLSMFPIKFEKTGNVSSITGAMDFATYMGAGIGSAIYGIILKGGNFNLMFYSWLAIAITIGALLLIIVKHPKLQKIPGDL